MIAVAVAMSVIIFMWSQGFLSQTSSSTGGQQGAQNQAAQSSISIELATFKTGAINTNAVNTPQITVVVRNVGAVGITPGSVTVTGPSSNAGFVGALTLGTLTTCPSSGTATTVTSTDGSWSCTLSSTTSIVGKGSSTTLVLTQATAALATLSKTQILSGDVINIKITTNVGTFAQAQFTVP